MQPLTFVTRCGRCSTSTSAVRSVGLLEHGAGHSAPITNVAYSPDGAVLATSSYDGSVILWTTLSGGVPSPQARIRHRRLVNAASWSHQHPGLLATASADKTVGIWRTSPDGARVESLGYLARHTDDVNAVAWLPDGERLVTASEDSTALIWELRTGRFLGKFATHSSHCMAVAVSPDGSVLTVGEDGEVFAGSLDQSAKHHRKFSASIEGCAWSPDGSRLALACDDGMVRVLSADLDLLDEIEVGMCAVRSVAFVADGSNRIVVGSYDASVRVLHGSSITLATTGGRLWPRSIDTTDNRVAVGSFGASPIILSLNGLQVLSPGGPDTNGPNALASSRGEVAIGLDSGLVVSVPVSTISAGRTIGATMHHVGADPVLSVASVARGWLAGTYGGSVVRLDTARGDDPVIGRVHLDSPVPSLAAHPDGAMVIGGTYDGRIVYLDVADSVKLQSSRRVHEGSVKSVQWLTSARAISGATDCSVRLLEDDGSDRILWYHGNLVNAIASDHRGLVASASRDRLIRAAVVADGQLRQFDLLGASESMKAVAVLGDGDDAWVIGGSYDFGVYQWHLDLADDNMPDARSGSVIFQADQAISTIVALDSRAAIVASWDGTVRLLELRKGHPSMGPAVRVEELIATARAEDGRRDEIGTAVVA